MELTKALILQSKGICVAASREYCEDGTHATWEHRCSGSPKAMRHDRNADNDNGWTCICDNWIKELNEQEAPDITWEVWFDGV